MPFSSHMPVLRGLIQILFLIFSIFMTIGLSVIRLYNIIFKRKSEFINPFRYAHKDVFRSRHDVIRVEGFKVIEYQCRTDDDVYVCLWRIIPEQNKQENQNEINSDLSCKSQKGSSVMNENKKPILIQHGLLDCSMSWFFHQQTLKTLPYMLAHQGYDVWIGNNRGTKFALKNSDQQSYWQYSLDHLAQYDIPCLIQNVLTITKSDKLIYIGHSQGSAQFLTALDIHPWLGDKVECFFGLGPLISMQYLNNHLLMKLLDKLRIMECIRFIGFKRMLSIPVWVSKLAGFMIYNSQIFSKFIHFTVNSLCGTNKSQAKINLQRFGIIMSHEPGGTSVNNVCHWVQIYRKGIMHKFDYGVTKNLLKYGKRMPPAYTHNILRQMQFQFHMFRGTSDSVITDEDWKYLTNKINPQKLNEYILQDYAHLDYVWSQDAYEDIYLKILDVISKRSKNMDNSISIEDKINGSLENTNDSQL